MRFPKPAVCCVILCLAGTGLQAQDAPKSVHSVIDGQRRAIYVTAERTGGSPKEWQRIEQDALSTLTAIAKANPAALTEQNAKGRLPLTRATALGFTSLTQALLQYPQVRAAIDVKGNDGLDAYDHTLLASKATLQACHPAIKNPFVLVPFLVTHSYYADRAPYPEIAAMLAAAGANTEQAAAKTSWLKVCTNKNPDERKRVADTEDMIFTLHALQAAAWKRQRQAEIEKSVAVFQEIFGPWVEKGKMSQDEFDRSIADIYRKAGLAPPGSAQAPE